MSTINKKKTGPKAGSKNDSTKTLADWYKVCNDFHTLGTKMSRTQFLKSDLTSEKFSGTQSEQMTFSNNYKKYLQKELDPDGGDRKRKRTPMYPELEKKLVEYIELRAASYTRDKLGLSWSLMRARALKYAKELNIENFEASDGWIEKVLKRNNLVGIKMHGEAGDMSDEKHKEIMSEWDDKVWKPALEWLVEDGEDDTEKLMDRIYNADQTGLYHQKLPNRMYVKKDQKKNYAGAKQMKDKNRITLMVCTAASGRKVALSIIGKAKNPLCFTHLPKKPMPYRNQKNAWFTKDVTLWWILNVLKPAHEKKHGRHVRALLLLDNCSAHKLSEAQLRMLPEWLKIVFLPPNVTNRSQPADMGMIASLKVGYKTIMLGKLLDIFDEEGGYEEAARRRKNTRKGCRGLDVGGKATILDAMLILNEIWDHDGKYAREDGIRRCWRKAGILPTNMATIINQDLGTNSIPNCNKVLNKEDSRNLCELMCKLQVKTFENQVDTNSIAIALQNSIADEDKLSMDELSSIADNWVNIEDEPEVVNVTIDEEIEAIENEILESTEVDDDQEPEVDVLAATIDDNDKLTKAQAEDMVSQLKFNCRHLGVDEDAFNHLDQFIRLVRNAKAKKSMKQDSMHSFFPSKK